MRPEGTSFGVRLLHGLLTAGGALALTLAFFFLLPLIQVMSTAPARELELASFDTTIQPPPPPPPPEEEPEEDEAEAEPPKLVEEAPPLDLAQLELVLDAGLGDWGVGEIGIQLPGMRPGEEGDAVEELFALADLDQKPRAVYQPGPVLSERVRRSAPGSVHIMFVVDPEGRVENPVVQDASDPVFEGPALAAEKQWRFEPGKRNGQPVRFRMRVPITFPKG
jgi:protein TonB